MPNGVGRGFVSVSVAGGSAANADGDFDEALGYYAIS